MLPLCRLCALLFLLVLEVGFCRAQERVVVLIDTNLPGATVYADSSRLGPAALGTFLVPASTSRVRLVPMTGETWSIAPVSSPLDASAGDTLELFLPFPYHYQIESIPFGASVFLETLDGRADMGRTPVLYTSPQVLDGTFVVEHQGYISEELTPGQDVWNRYVLTLQPVDPQEVQTAELVWRPPPKRHRWIDYTAGAVAVAAGLVSIHYKFKADRINDRYQKTGDPTLRPRVRDLDIRAGVAFGVMQVGVGVLVFRFVTR